MKTNDEIVQGIGGALSGFGGFLRCETCGERLELDDADVARYLGSGWPRHTAATRCVGGPLVKSPRTKFQSGRDGCV